MGVKLKGRKAQEHQRGNKRSAQGTDRRSYYCISSNSGKYKKILKKQYLYHALAWVLEPFPDVD
jgi:hypothetical protein